MTTLAGLVNSGSNGAIDERELGQRIRLVSSRNPYMAQRPDLLMQLAQSPYDTDSLVHLSGQLYAMQAGDSLAQQLRGLGGGAQRAIVSRLSIGQQQALAQMGYQPPERDEGGLFQDVVGVVSKPLSVISHGAGAIPGVKQTVSAGLDLLNWVSAYPGHLYRTVRTMGEGSEFGAVGGALLGVGAVALAPTTGGGSLAALGLFGGGALLGATAGAVATNPGDWWRAFGATKDGEKTFERGAIKRADELLADPRMHGAAQDLVKAGLNVVDFAHEMAGHRGIDANTQLRAMESLADTMATKGSPEYTRIVTAMTNALNDPTFQEAVQTLNNGKISPGRDLADTFGLDPGSTTYNLISGATDALFTVAVDPTLMLGYASKAYKAARYTFTSEYAGAELASAYRAWVGQRPAVMRTYDALAEAVNHAESGGLQILRTKAPQMEQVYDQMIQYRQALIDQGQLRNVAFSGSDVIQYFANETNFKPILEGIGSVKNARATQIYAEGVTTQAARAFRGEVRSFLNGMADIGTEEKLAKLASKHGVIVKGLRGAERRAAVREIINQEVAYIARNYGRGLEERTGIQHLDMIGEDGLIGKPWRFDGVEQNIGAYELGRRAEQVPLLGRAVGRVGSALSAMTTMSISGKAIALTGPAATKEIRALAELGRYMGMPSYMRHAWADTILSSTSAGARYDAMHGWVANIMRMTGIADTPEGEAMVKQYLEASKKLYGPNDEVLVNGHRLHLGIYLNDQADKVVMPDLHELRQAAVTGMWGRLMGVADLPVIEPMMNKIWKPMVLLRLGFIPRAAGEELVSFLLRGGLGSLAQEFGGRNLGELANLRDAQEIVNKARMLGRPVRGLTADQERLIARGVYSALPAHVRPVARIFDRFGWGDPNLEVFQRYGRWLERELTGGVFHARRVAYRPGESAVEQLQRASFGAHNVAEHARSIVLGKEYSLRRMLVGGVHDDKVAAGREWSKIHSTQIMRDVSSTSQGLFDPGYDHSQIHKTMVEDPTGELRPVYVLPEKGVRQTVTQDDTAFEGALFNDLQRAAHDPAFREDMTRNLAFVRGGANVTEADLAPHLDRLIFANHGQAHHEQARAIGRELFNGRFRRDHWDAMVAELARSKNSQLISQSLSAYLKGMKDPTLDDITEALMRARTDLQRVAFKTDAEYMAARRQLSNLTKELNENIKPTVEWLNTLDPNSRAFASQLLHGQSLEGRASFWARRGTALSEEPVPEGMVRLYRGRYAPGGRVPGPGGKAPDWVLEDPKYKARGSVEGRWFTTDRDLAGRYPTNMEPGERAELAFVDIPQAEYDQIKGLADQPEEVRGLSSMPDREVVIPERYLPAVRPVTRERWLFDDLHEARDMRIDHVQSKLLDPMYHDQGVTSSMRGLSLDPETGQLRDVQLRDSTVTLYEAPRFDGFTWDALVQHSSDPAFLLEHQGVIRQILDADPADAALVADYRLAQELHRIDASLAGLDPALANRPRMLRRSRTVTDGRIHGGLRPDTVTKTNEGTRLFYFPRSMAEPQLAATPDTLLDPVRGMAEDMVARHDDLIRRHNRQTVRFDKTRTLEDGTQEALVYRWRGSKLVPVDPTEEVPLSEVNMLKDYKGQPIDYASTKYSTQPIRETDAAPSGEVMWEMLGPTMQDAWDSRNAATRFRQRADTSPYSLPGRRGPAQTEQTVPLFRAAMSDVRGIPADALPLHAIAEVAKNRPVGSFERFVNFGFDKVIGPAIDAIVRKPMAFHAFADRYTAAQKALEWTIAGEHIANMEQLYHGYRADLQGAADPELLGRLSRSLAAFDGDEMAYSWGLNHSLAWLRGHTEGELDDLLTRAQTIAAHDPAGKAVAQHARALEQIGYKGIQRGAAGGKTLPEMIDYIESQLPEGVLRNWTARVEHPDVQKAIADNPLLKYIDRQGEAAWAKVTAAHTSLTYNRELSGELAATAAVRDAVPFIDSHEFKTQFADYASGFVPFWYAEENFAKRWLRGLADEGPAMIRKMQLGYMGMKQAGIVRTDQQGRDWFVYPGSGLLAAALSNIPGLDALGVDGLMFQTPTDAMLPGLNNRLGVPSFNPLVSVPMGLATAMFPELTPAKRAVLGDFAAGQDALSTFVPSTLRNAFGAITGDAASSQRYASAMMTAIAWAEAHGQAPGDDATPGEVDAFMDRVRKHARIVLAVQTIGGFIVPGAPSEIVGGRSANLAGINVDNPGEYLASEYLSLVRLLGVEAGTQKYLEMNPEGSLDGIVNPLAYTVPRNVSASGAPIPSTEEAFQFTQDNADYFSEFPNAAPWLLPQNTKGGRSQYAYDQAIADGLRDRRSPDEFFAAMKFKIGAQQYFATKDEFTKRINQAVDNGDASTASDLRAEMDWQLQVYRMAHPLFAAELASSDGRDRRGKVIAEMRSVVDDPYRPGADQGPGLTLAMHAFDSYSTRLAVLQNDHSATGRRAVDDLKTRYESYMTNLVGTHPEISSFWISVLRPEASLG